MQVSFPFHFGCSFLLIWFWCSLICMWLLLHRHLLLRYGFAFLIANIIKCPVLHFQHTYIPDSPFSGFFLFTNFCWLISNCSCHLHLRRQHRKLLHAQIPYDILQFFWNSFLSIIYLLEIILSRNKGERKMHLHCLMHNLCCSDGWTSVKCV